MTRRSAAAVGALLALSASAEEPFALQSIGFAERIVQAEIADLDGDARGDLVCIGLSGLPPAERRVVHVLYQRPDGSLPDAPDWSGALPTGAAGYDLAPLDERPGAELVLLRRDRLTLLSWPERLHRRRDLPTGPVPTLAVGVDDRGIDRLQLVQPGLADAPRLVVPGLGFAALLTASGELLARLDVGARTNYFLPPRPAPVFSESEAQIYYDHPRLVVGDVDGDGRGDLVSAGRYELRVFVQDAQGGFPERASRSVALGRVSAEDHMRNAGSVRVDGADFDGDGRLDLLIASSSGTVFSSSTRTTLHLNRGGDWKLDAPDQEFRRKGGLSATMLFDLDGDGRVELIDVHVPTGVLEVVEVLVTRAIDAQLSLYRRGEGALFGSEPWHRRKLGVGWSLNTFRTLGFVPTLLADLNGDGLHDLLGSGDGDRLEIHLGDREQGLGARRSLQALDTGGRIRFGDLEGDGLADFVLYDPRRPDAPVRVLRNRGLLPGTRPSLRGSE